MVKEICKDIYLSEIDLPQSPLKYLNSYIVKTDHRNLIIDTGFNRTECIESFFAGLKELDIDLKKTDVLVTHLHSDHCGLIGELKKLGAKILIGAVEAKELRALSGSAYWERFGQRALMYGIAAEEITVLDHPGYSYRPELVDDYRSLEEGDVLNYGDYTFQVLFVPGHTCGHIALYEAKNKLFFCGDLILDKITPTITFWGFQQDILQVYFDTLQKVSKLPVDIVLTGHRAILYDCGKRIKELVEHHVKRLDEIKEILKQGEQSVCEVAAKMTWEIRAKSWNDFPKAQKWFATGEAMAHLEHLYCKGMAKRREENGKFLYSNK